MPIYTLQVGISFDDRISLAMVSHQGNHPTHVLYRIEQDNFFCVETWLQRSDRTHEQSFYSGTRYHLELPSIKIARNLAAKYLSCELMNPLLSLPESPSFFPTRLSFMIPKGVSKEKKLAFFGAIVSRIKYKEKSC